MKKKFIRALLFGALIGLQATAFVSCKDYDDDINALRTEITTNASDLKSLVDEKMKNVETEISALQATANGLETAYKAADKALETAITNATNDAKGYADVQAAEAQKAAVASAQTLVDNATKKLEESLAASKQVDSAGIHIVQSLYRIDYSPQVFDFGEDGHVFSVAVALALVASATEVEAVSGISLVGQLVSISCHGFVGQRTAVGQDDSGPFATLLGGCVHHSMNLHVILFTDE